MPRLKKSKNIFETPLRISALCATLRIARESLAYNNTDLTPVSYGPGVFLEEHS